jgi:phospholipid/cholesterol/gamma-HCH transport system permease protein
MTGGLHRVEPEARPAWHDGSLTLALSGEWTAARGRAMEAAVDALADTLPKAGALLIDVSRVTKLDTLGALLLKRIEAGFHLRQAAFRFSGASPEQAILLREVSYAPPAGDGNRPRCA